MNELAILATRFYFMNDFGVRDVTALGDDINKLRTEDAQKEGVVSDFLPELSLSMEDTELLALADKWESSWMKSHKKEKWEKQIKENRDYYLGKHPSGGLDQDRPIVDNVIFESLETFLPQATRRNPEPQVLLDADEEETEVNMEYTQKVKKKLDTIVDKNKIRLKLKRAARYWAIDQLGVAKMGWDLDKDIPKAKIIDPKLLILDPNATLDEDGYNGEFVGEIRKMPAWKILGISNSEKVKKEIEKITLEKNSTMIQFKEWWTSEYMFWTLNKFVLYKAKNPNWNEDVEQEEIVVDDYGLEQVKQNKRIGINHLPIPSIPYVFMSVFNLGDTVTDSTSLIQQNLANQDIINKRNKQIDANADKMNNGLVISLERSGLTKEQAGQANTALQRGATIVIPSGSPNEAISRMPAIPLPADVYNDLGDKRNRLKDIFGVKGLSQSGLANESTVRGKIIGRTLDTDRIGGGVTEYLEQFADDIYNWFVQLLYVYDNNFQFVPGATPPKIEVSVKEGSLLPKDSTTIANQAIDLAAQGKMSLIDLYKRLDYPNAEELAANAWLEINAPQLLYADNPMVQQATQSSLGQMAQPPQGQTPPSNNLLGQVPTEGQVPLDGQL